jgi:hypothetical protein
VSQVLFAVRLAASFAFGRAVETLVEQVRAAARSKMSIPLLFFGGAKSLAGAFKDHLDQIAMDARLLRSRFWPLDD